MNASIYEPVPLFIRQDCPADRPFYNCHGFKGCCSIDPCDPGGVCPDDNDGDASTQSSASAMASTSVPLVIPATSSNPATISTATVAPPVSLAAPTSASPASTPLPLPQPSSISTSPAVIRSSVSTTPVNGLDTISTKPSTASISSASPILMQSTSITLQASAAVTACPSSNNTMFNDDSQISYQLICGVDTSGPALSSFSVANGGLQSCLSSCDTNEDCQGVTFVGNATGTCSLRKQLGAYATCPENNVCTSALKMSTEASKGHGTNLGVIIGPAVAGALVAAIIALFAFICIRKRRRQQKEKKNLDAFRRRWSDVSDTEPAVPTKNQDVFAPFGGFYRGVKDMCTPDARNEKKQDDTKKPAYHVVNQDTTEVADQDTPINNLAQLDGRPISELADTSRPNSHRDAHSPLPFDHDTYDPHGTPDSQNKASLTPPSRYTSGWSSSDGKEKLSRQSMLSNEVLVDGVHGVSPMLSSRRDSHE